MIAMTELLRQLESMTTGSLTSNKIFVCEPGFDNEQRSFFLKLRLSLLEITQKLADMEAAKPVKKVEDSFVQMVLNRIEILKNIIKKEMDDADLFSMNLTAVESIEKDIRDSGSVSQAQMKKLNEIYKNVNI